MLEIESLNSFYGPVQVLHDVSMEVAEGEVVTLLGSNGAGKSTTLRSISGLMRPAQGTIRFDGQLLNGRSPESIARLGISHVPEGRQIFPGLSVLENLQLGSSKRRPKRADVLADLDRVFEIFPRLRELKDRAGWGLSGGEQQMLAIGRGIMARPRLLLLDEPSLGLAPIIVSQMFQVIRQLKQSRTTLLLVEQNAHQALRVADRGYVLESGRVVLADTAADLLDSEQMRAAYLGKSGAAEVRP
jgi:branched-chain amino acid transport system ATP-binding protein